jgi:replicative DNA helicase
MDNLIDRTEAALLGALLADRAALEAARFLVAEDFHKPEHQALYRAVVDVHLVRGPDLDVTAHIDLVVRTADHPDVTGDALRALTADAADPELVPVYARMVQEAAVRTMLASHVDRILERSLTTGGPEGQHLALLAQALTAQAQPFTAPPSTTAEPEHDRTPAATAVPDISAPERERAVLADLVQHPGELPEVRPWLTPDTFAPGPHREAYEAITAVADRGEPLTDLTVTWELARRQATVAPERQTHIDTAGYTHTPVEPGTAVQLGHQMLTEQLRTHLHQTPQPAPVPQQTTQAQQPLATPEPAIEPQPEPRPSGPTIGR